MIDLNPHSSNGRGISGKPDIRFPLIVFLLFLGCERLLEYAPDNASNATGILYTSNGSYAEHRLIRFIDGDIIALPGSVIPVDSVYTDSMGRYSVQALSDGAYNAFGESGGELFFRAGITVKKGVLLCDTLRDTLGPPGSLFVFVKHRHHGDVRHIMGLMPGTGRYLTPGDSTGMFACTGFARGTYHVQFLSTLPQYARLAAMLTVRSGETDTLSDTIYLEYREIPQVAGFSAAYDNRSNSVYLSWSGMDTLLAPGYIVYRKENGQALEPLTSSPVADTFYTDSNPALWITYEYRVAGYRNGKNGPLSEIKTIRTILKPEGWYKGQMHCHTAGSDGALPVSQVLRMYREAGYDFVAASDHNMVTQTGQFNDTGFITIPNDELSFGIKHVNAINAVRHYTGPLPDPILLQDVIDAALSVGAVPQINHPQYSQHSAMDIFRATGVYLMEIVNYRHDDPVHNAALWDSVLSMGKRIYGTAGDDAHDYVGDFNKGWIMVKTLDFTRQGILSAIEAGEFYASSGPVITKIVKEGRAFGVESADGVAISFIGPYGKKLTSVDASSASFTLPAGVRYARVEVMNARGKVAYTQAYFPKITPSGDR